MIPAIYNKYIGKLTCAYMSDIFVDEYGTPRVMAKRTQEREKYLFKGLGNGRDPILIECPPDVLVLEFEGERLLNEEIIRASVRRIRSYNLDYCIADHGGKSPYIYLFNLIGLPAGFEAHAKKILAKKFVPHKYLSLLDLSNLGKTLVPIIGRPHWKPCYNGSIHKRVKGKWPEVHYNPVGEFCEDFYTPPSPKAVGEYDSELKRIKERVLLSKLLKSYGLDTSRNPTRCLWHEKGARCFSFDDRKGLWNCFHCGRSGNVFQFIMEQEKCGFVEAKKKSMNL